MIENEASTLIEATQQEKQPDMIRFATVVGTFENTGAPIIQFAGDTEPSQKSYAYMAWYSPTVGDTVACVKTGNSYFILGNVNYKIAPTGDIESKVNDVLSQKRYLETATDGSINVSSDTVNTFKSISCSTQLTTKTFGHSGTIIRFFGHSYVGQQSVSKCSTSSTVSVDAVASCVNEVIQALRNYGLLSS